MPKSNTITKWPHAMLYKEFVHRVVAHYRNELKAAFKKEALHAYVYNRAIIALNQCLGKSPAELDKLYITAVQQYKHSKGDSHEIMAKDKRQLCIGSVVMCVAVAEGRDIEATPKAIRLTNTILEGKDIKTENS